MGLFLMVGFSRLEEAILRAETKGGVLDALVPLQTMFSTLSSEMGVSVACLASRPVFFCLCSSKCFKCHSKVTGRRRLLLRDFFGYIFIFICSVKSSFSYYLNHEST